MEEIKPLYIVISDIVSFVQSVYKIQVNGITDIKPFLENIAEKGKYHKVYFFVGVNQQEASMVTGKKVYDKFIVNYKDTACTSQRTGGKREITLITCTNASDENRVIVKAREIK